MNTAATIAIDRSQAKANTAKRDELITGHLHLVNTIAAHVRRSVSVHIELDDLIHAGTMGLFDAASKYRAEKEVAFSTYAKHRIRGAILDSLRQLDWASRDMRKRYKQVEAITRELNEKLGSTPCDTELADGLGVSLDRWRRISIELRSLGTVSSTV